MYPVCSCSAQYVYKFEMQKVQYYKLLNNQEKSEGGVSDFRLLSDSHLGKNMNVSEKFIIMAHSPKEKSR